MVVHKSFNFDHVPGHENFVYVGTESNLPKAAQKGFTTVGLKSDSRNFYGSDNLAKLDSGSVDGAVLENAMLSKGMDLDSFLIG